MSRRRTHNVAVIACTCHDCDAVLMARGAFGTGWDADWFLVKDRVWRAATGGSDAVRFLCVGCLENRIKRKLVATDFKSSAKVNFTGVKSVRLRRRMRGLVPAKHLRNTTFTP